MLDITKKTAVVSIMNALPQYKYMGDVKSDIPKVMNVALGSPRDLLIRYAGIKVPSIKRKLIIRPVALRSFFRTSAWMATIA